MRNNTLILLFIIFIVFILYFYPPQNNNKCSSENFTIDDLNIAKHGDESYWLYEIDNLLTPEECDIVIKEAYNKGFEQSTVYTNGSSVLADTRNSNTCWLDNNVNIANKISSVVNKLVDYPLENQEALQVVKYPPGGYFNLHHDATDYDGPLKDRIITFLIYLNDDFTGGETEFPQINKKIIPKKGKAVIFWTTDNNSNILPKSLHAGVPVKSGTKYICNKWIHINKF